MCFVDKEWATLDFYSNRGGIIVKYARSISILSLPPDRKEARNSRVNKLLEREDFLSFRWYARDGRLSLLRVIVDEDGIEFCWRTRKCPLSRKNWKNQINTVCEESTVFAP